MSHSKVTKNGKSLYIEKYNSATKNFINTCSICGKQGYKPSICDDGFINPSAQITNHSHSAMYNQITKCYKQMAVDELGRCEICANVMDNKK